MNVDFGTGIYGILGPNGAGKSTLFRMLSTVEKPEAGEIAYQGEDIFQMGESYREKLGYVPQKPGYYHFRGHTGCISYLKKAGALN